MPGTPDGSRNHSYSVFERPKETQKFLKWHKITNVKNKLKQKSKEKLN